MFSLAFLLVKQPTRLEGSGSDKTDKTDKSYSLNRKHGNLLDNFVSASCFKQITMPSNNYCKCAIDEILAGTRKDWDYTTYKRCRDKNRSELQR